MGAIDDDDVVADINTRAALQGWPMDTLHFDGQKDPDRRRRIETGNWVGIEDQSRFLPYVKTTATYALRINQPFTVDTPEGVHEGKAGDWLAVGIHGEMYPIDAAVFEESYAPLPEKEANPDG
jgi:hypothetical protein